MICITYYKKVKIIMHIKSFKINLVLANKIES